MHYNSSELKMDDIYSAVLAQTTDITRRYRPVTRRAGVIFQRPTSDGKSSIVHVTCRHNRSLLRIADYLDNGSAIAIAPEDPRGGRRGNAASPELCKKRAGKGGEIVNWSIVDTVTRRRLDIGERDGCRGIVLSVRRGRPDNSVAVIKSGN